MSLYETCPYCEELHDILAVEPSFQKPDAYIAVPAAERDARTLLAKDACAVRDSADADRRYFLRVLAPFRVTTLEAPISWGLWVEVSEEHFTRTQELWDDPNQSTEPPFPGRVANKLPGYDQTLPITGLITLTDASNIPTILFTAPANHRLVLEQRLGVTTRRVAEWLVPIYHPEWLVQQKINESLKKPAWNLPALEDSPDPPAKKSWWRFWS